MADNKEYKALANINKQIFDQLTRLCDILILGESTDEDHFNERLGLPPSSLLSGVERFRRNKTESLTKVKKLAQNLIAVVDMIEQYDHTKEYINTLSEQK